MTTIEKACGAILDKTSINLLLAIEVGYKAAEAGHSLEATLHKARMELLCIDGHRQQAPPA